MASDRSRRDAPSSNASWTNSPPVAQTLSASRGTVASTRSAIARFVSPSLFSSYGPRTSSSQPSRTEPRAGGQSPRYPGSDSLTAQDATYDTNLPNLEIASLDVSPDRTHAVLAGREILQTISVVGNTCSEHLNLRASLANRGGSNIVRSRDTLDIHDVKWSHGQFQTYIAAAASNGKIIVYDLARPGYEVARLHEHTRQVHRVAFSPHQGFLLLSGSQDATVKLWDLRATRSEAMTCRSRSRFAGAADGIRDLRWSPREGFDFAIGTDNGSIQRWDYRFPAMSKLRISSAHDMRVMSIDWHPDGKHLMSASQDQTLKVWDFSSDARRQKPEWTLKTPFPVMNARWRPPCWAVDHNGRGNWQSTQVVTSYERVYAVSHVWDFRRPHMPFREIHTSHTAPTDMVWRSKDLLWSVSRDGKFFQSDVQYAPKPIDRRPVQTFAISPLGELFVCGQKRHQTPKTDPSYAHESDSDMKNKYGILEKTEISKSSFDDSVDESFLSSSYKREDGFPSASVKRYHDRTGSVRSSKSANTTPPSDNEIKVAPFDEAMNKSKPPLRPRQLAFSGRVDGVSDSEDFRYIAQKAKVNPFNGTPKIDGFIYLRNFFETNAVYYRRISLYDHAQTWSLMGTLVMSLLAKRALGAWRRKSKEEREILIRKKEEQNRLKRDEVTYKLPPHEYRNDSTGELPGQASVKRVEKVDFAHVKSTETSTTGGEDLRKRLDGLQTPISTSNMATPIARPAGSKIDFNHARLPEPDAEGDQLKLPEAVFGRSVGNVWSTRGDHQLPSTAVTSEDPIKHASAVPPSMTMQEQKKVNHAMASISDRKAATGNFRPQPKVPLDFSSPRLDPVTPTRTAAINIRPSLDRHNSGESFGMFSASSDSQVAGSGAASYTSLRSRSNSMRGIPELTENATHFDAGFRIPHVRRTSATPDPTIPNVEAVDQDFFNTFDESGTSASTNMFNVSDPPEQLIASTGRYNFTETGLTRELQPLRRNMPRDINMVEVSIADQDVGDGANSSPRNTGTVDLRKVPVFYDIPQSDLEVNQPAEFHTAHIHDVDLFIPERLSEDDKRSFLSHLALSDFISDDISRDEFDALKMEDMLARLKLYYTNTNPDPQIVENLARAVAAALSPLNTMNLAEADKAIWLAYFDLLHRNLQPAVAMALAKTSQIPDAETAFDWPATGTAAVNCIDCDRPANNGECLGCGRRLGSCIYCWERQCPFPWPVKAKSPRDLIIPTTKITNAGSFDDHANEDVPAAGASAVVGGAHHLSGGGLWSFCLACNHGIHAGCREDWRARGGDLAGDCPFPGCDCPCDLRKEGSGRRRFSAVGTEEVVLGEERRVRESGAVKGAGKILEGGKRVEFVLRE